MWTCPACGREFKRTNQGHYCGKAPATVEEYIGLQAVEAQSHLNAIRNAIRGSVPDVGERIAWSMPTYDKAGRSLSFAACKKHVSLYVGADAIAGFKSGLEEFTTNKSAVYLPYDKALPLELIADMAAWCFGEAGNQG